MKSKKLTRFIDIIERSGFLLPASLAFYLLVKTQNTFIPGFSCPLRHLIGVPCPTCFLTRATGLALQGNIEDSIRMHAFGPIFAFFLVIWSINAIIKKQLFPVGIKDWHIGLTSICLIIYWLIRLILSFGLGIWGFPGFMRI